MTGIALLAAATGAVLLYAGFKGLDPRSLFTSVFTGNQPTPLSGIAPATSANNPYGANVPAPTGTRAGNRVGQTVIQKAGTFIGAPYLRGGSSMRGIDCSGLSSASYAAAGITLPHSAAAQFAMCVPILKSSLSPGDLIFMPLGETGISHVAIYIGNGRTIESAPSHNGVGIVLETYQPGPHYYGRPVQAFTKATHGSH